jgi:hypothetical protein
MKKVLEDELMSLAHRILKLRNRAEIHELKEEAAVLYEKLSVLSFAEKHFEGVKPTISKYDVEKSIEKDHHEATEKSDYPDGTEYNEEQIYEHNTEKIKDIVSQMPYESTQVDKMFEDKHEDSIEHVTSKDTDTVEDEIEDFGVHFDDLPDFEPLDESKDNNENEEKDEDEKPQEKEDENQIDTEDKNEDEKPQKTIDLFSQQKKSLNDSLNKELKIGLNDRLSFIIHLFQGNKEEYESFLEHINKLNNFEEVKAFLDERIKNKYDYWKDNEDIANRLLHLIEKKFE